MNSPIPKARQTDREALVERIADIIREQHLTSIYHCTRVWAAWSVGTMTEDDFEPAAESELADEIAAGIVDALSAPPPQEVGWPCEIAEADFEANTITVKMLTNDYRVRAGKHFLRDAGEQAA